MFNKYWRFCCSSVKTLKLNFRVNSSIKLHCTLKALLHTFYKCVGYLCVCVLIHIKTTARLNKSSP